MTQKKSYSRYFIILQEDEKGYALASDKLPSGYAKLEIKNDKCKVSYYVQNLKKESAPYYMVLVCNKKDAKKLLKLGELNIDEHGRAEVSYEYPVESVGNFSINVDKVVGASIVRFMNSNIIPVMSGFTTTEIPEWKGFPMIEEEKNRQEEDRMDKKVQPAKVEPVKVEPVVTEPANVEPVIEEPEKTAPMVEEQPAVDNPQPTNIFDEYEMQIEVEKQNVEEQPNDNMPMGILEDSEIDMDLDRKKEKCKDGVCEIKHENECHDNEKHEHQENKCKHNEEQGHHENKCKDNEEHGHHENKCKDNEKHEHHENDWNNNEKHEHCENKCKKERPKGSVGDFFMKVAEDFEELENICTEIKRCSWYKVPVYRPEDMNCMDYNKHTVVYYPMNNYYQYIRKFGHFVLGYKLDKDNKMKYLVYGIPGTKARADQPFAGRTGFVTWVPLKEGDEGEDSYGYWLMFYDFRNSTIVIPVK